MSNSLNLLFVKIGMGKLLTDYARINLVTTVQSRPVNEGNVLRLIWPINLLKTLGFRFSSNGEVLCWHLLILNNKYRLQFRSLNWYERQTVYPYGIFCHFNFLSSLFFRLMCCRFLCVCVCVIWAMTVYRITNDFSFFMMTMIIHTELWAVYYFRLDVKSQ